MKRCLSVLLLSCTPTAVARPLIDSIRGGSFVFAYYPDPAWLKQSRLLSADCGSGVAARPVSSAAGR